MRVEGKLTNADGEFIASGPCEIDHERGDVTMWPSWEMHMLERERGALTLELADGRSIAISNRHLTFKLSGPTEHRISVYRLHILERVPEHLVSGYVEPESAAPPTEAAAGEESQSIASERTAP